MADRRPAGGNTAVMRPHLVFVYNADSGVFNTLTDIAHKLLSPSTYACTLCALTYGHFTARQQWIDFLRTLDAEYEFLHRDEFHARHGMPDAALPAVFIETRTGLSPLLTAETVNACASLDAVIDLLRRALAQRLADDQNVN